MGYLTSHRHAGYGPEPARRTGRTAGWAAALAVLIVGAATAVAPGAAAAATQDYTVTTSIPLTNWPTGIGIDQAAGSLYLGNIWGGTVSAVDLASNTVLGDVSTGGSNYSHEIGVDPTTRTVYVSNWGTGTVSVIDEATRTVTHTISVGYEPTGVGVDPSTHTVFVANMGNDGGTTPAPGYVSVIDTVTNTVTATIPGSTAYLWAVGVDPASHRVYVSNFHGGSVSVIDESTLRIVGEITVPRMAYGPYALAVDSTTHTVYVANSDIYPTSGSVSVIDATTDTVTATVPVGTNPKGIAVDTATHTIYVTNDSDSTVSVIDGNSHAVLQTVSGIGRPQAVAVDPTTHTAYVSAAQPYSIALVSTSDQAQLSVLGAGVRAARPGMSLTGKITAAETALASGDRPAACSSLQAFIHEVEAQTGKKLTPQQAATFIADAQRIQVLIGC